ncbi:plastocyanin/azurin family copper-binding protein [Salinisphaera sp. T31B1]|uniref:plastocyanin/azurin family copper-binding protein n=1 Tax=Salinisphaera sp. T31B1 TaxID=727963 RepID=UPI00333E8775
MLKKSLVFMLFAVLSASAFAVQAKTVEIEGKNSLRFSEEAISAKPGEEITIKLTNNSKLPAAAMAHNWVLLKADADAQKIDEAAAKAKSNDYIPSDMSDQIIAHTGLVGGGESDTVTFKAPTEPGEYTYICTFPGHFAAGMKGTLTVK